MLITHKVGCICNKHDRLPFLESTIASIDSSIKIISKQKDSTFSRWKEKSFSVFAIWREYTDTKFHSTIGINTDYARKQWCIYWLLISEQSRNACKYFHKHNIHTWNQHIKVLTAGPSMIIQNSSIRLIRRIQKF